MVFTGGILTISAGGAWLGWEHQIGASRLH